MKKHFKVIVYRKDGSSFENPLMLSETHLLGQMARENFKIEVSLKECTKDEYKTIFSK